MLNYGSVDICRTSPVQKSSKLAIPVNKHTPPMDDKFCLSWGSDFVRNYLSQGGVRSTDFVCPRGADLVGVVCPRGLQEVPILSVPGVRPC